MECLLLFYRFVSWKPQVGSHKLEATSWKPQVGSHKLEATSWKPQAFLLLALLINIISVGSLTAQSMQGSLFKFEEGISSSQNYQGGVAWKDRWNFPIDVSMTQLNPNQMTTINGFKVVFADDIAMNGIGFNDALWGQMRKDNLSAVLSYITSKIDIGTAQPIIYVDLSEQDSLDFIIKASSFFDSNNPQGNLMSGALRDYIVNQTNPLPTGMAHAYLKVDFGLKQGKPIHNNHTTTCNGDIDLYSVLLFGLTRAMGIHTLIQPNGVSVLSNLPSGPFSHFDKYLYASGAYLLDATNTYQGSPNVNQVSYSNNINSDNYDLQTYNAPPHYLNGFNGDMYPQAIIQFEYHGIQRRSLSLLEMETFCNLGYNVNGGCSNRYPLAKPEDAQYTPGQLLCISPLDNDIDKDGDVMSIDLTSLFVDSTAGSYSIMGNQICFLPDATFDYTTAIYYRLTDGITFGNFTEITLYPNTIGGCTPDFICPGVENLVPNSSFEDANLADAYVWQDAFANKEDSFYKRYGLNKGCWKKVKCWCRTIGSPNLGVRGHSNWGIPFNGVDTPFGDKLAAFGTSVYWKEGIQTHLTQPLNPNKYYRLSFHAAAVQIGVTSLLTDKVMAFGFDSNTNPPAIFQGNANPSSNGPGNVGPNTQLTDGFTIDIHPQSNNVLERYSFPPLGTAPYQPSVADLQYLVFENIDFATIPTNTNHWILLDNVRLYEVPNVSITKTSSIENPMYGQPFSYTITVCNNGLESYQNIQVEDYLPANLIYLGTGTYFPITTIASLAPGTCQSWTIPVTLNTSGLICKTVFTNCAKIINIDGFCLPILEEENLESCVTLTAANTDIGITQVLTQAPTGVGSIVSYDFTVQNEGPLPISNVVITGVPPCMSANSVTFSPSSNVSYNPVTNQFTIGGLCANCSLTVSVSAVYSNSTFVCTICSNLVGFAEEGVTLLECEPGNDYDCDDLPILNGNIEINKFVNNPTPNIGDVVTYYISVNNTTSVSMAQISVEDVMPDCIGNPQVVLASGQTLVGNTVTINQIPAFGSSLITITGTYLNGTSACKNCAYLMTPLPGQNDSNPNDNSGCAIIEPLETDLSIQKRYNEEESNGGMAVFEVTITNNGTMNATQVEIEDIWQGGDCLSYLYYQSQIEDLTASSYIDATTQQGHTTFLIPFIEAGNSATITVFFNKPLACTECQNCVSIVGFNGIDPELENNTSCTTATIDYSGADLALTPYFTGNANYPNVTGTYPNFFLNGALNGIKVIVSPYATLNISTGSIATITDCDVLMMEGSAIEVANNATLNINRTLTPNTVCHLYGCKRMWRGINIQEGGYLQIKGVTTTPGTSLVTTHPVIIEDAAYAVSIVSPNAVQGSTNSGLITMCEFINNYVGIRLNSAASGVLFEDALTQRLDKNLFDSNRPLLEPYIGNTSVGINAQSASFYDAVFPRVAPYAGMEVHNHTVIMNTRTRNVFAHLNNGIVAFESHLRLSTPAAPNLNNWGLQRFYFIKSYDADKNFYDGSGIFSMGNRDGAYLLYEGISGSINAIIDFSDCDYGVYAYNSELYFKHHHMENMKCGIYVEEGSPYLTLAQIDSNAIGAIERGIHIVPVEGSGSYYIHHNLLNMDDGDPNSNILTLNSFGIGALGINMPSSVVIRENTVNMNDCSVGILSLASAKYWSCESNTVNMIGANNLAAYCNAGTPNARFECNQANGANGFIGYKIDMSPRTSLICNYADATAWGMGFWGLSPNSTVKGNTFHANALYGLYYSSSAITGGQDNTGNQWTGTAPATWGAFHAGGSFMANQSPYKVSPFAAPHIPQTVSPGGNNWFSFVTSTPMYLCAQNTYCGAPSNGNLTGGNGGGITDLDRAIAKDNVQIPFYEAETRRLAAGWLYSKLYHTPTLLGLDTEIDSFYNAQNTTNVHDFEVVQNTTHHLNVFTDSLLLSALQDSVYKYQSLTISQDSSLAGAVTTQDSMTIIGQREVALSIWANWQDSLQKNLYLADSLQRQPLVTQVLNDNEEIVTTDLQEENMQIINKLYLETIARGNRVWDEMQIAVLNEIRQQCPLAGGEAVYKARSLYARLYPGQWLYDDESICAVNDMAWRQTPSLQSVTPFIKAYPNPTSDLLSFEWGNLVGETVTISIYDATGRLILSENVPAEKGQWQCSVKTWSKGVYAYTLTAQAIYTGKCIVE